MQPVFSASPGYVESVRSVLRLHELEVLGASETEQAEAARAELERHWSVLTDAERARLTGLSQDLYSLIETTESSRNDPDVQRKLSEIFDARQSGQFDHALELLREWEPSFDPAICSYWRGRIWTDAGGHEVAATFLKHAAEVGENPHYQALYLEALSRSDPAAASSLASEAFKAPSVPPVVLVRAAEIRLSATKLLPADQARPILQELATKLEKFLAEAELKGPESLRNEFGPVYAMAIFLAAYCYDHLGHYDLALTLYNKAIAAEPKNEALLIMRGILRYGVDQTAIHDFENAVRLGATVVWPYFFLAHYYLLGNRFLECHEMCQRALAFPSSDAVRACLFEWIGISRSELGFQPQYVREAFQSAIELKPDDDRIRANLDAFERALSNTRRTFVWQKEPATVIQEFGRSEHRHATAA